MTVSKKIQSTLATLEGVAADFKRSCIESTENTDKEMFKMLIRDTEDILKNVEGRLEDIKNKEKEYRKE
ncbi:MAG: DUF1657 domain-containing protein [Clostridium sp.]|nr:DUF1657 domain-containing protein [Clostridium sp.]